MIGVEKGVYDNVIEHVLEGAHGAHYHTLPTCRGAHALQCGGEVGLWDVARHRVVSRRRGKHAGAFVGREYRACGY